MHRRLTLLAIVAALAASVTAVAGADPTRPDPNLAGLQVALSVKGFYRGPIDGLRGPLTATALRAFQQHARLASTNVPTARTLAALGRLGRPRYGTRTLRRGMVGLDVAALQFELRYHGFPNPGHGGFGGRTMRALERFQRYAGLHPDGVAGRATYLALRTPPPRAPRLFFPLPSFTAAAHAGRAAEIACAYATAIASATRGVVSFAGNRGRGYGYTVVVESRNGLRVVYGHLARIDVKVGEPLVAGAFVGLAGWTGKRRASTTLRIELRLRGAQIDAYSALFRR